MKPIALLLLSCFLLMTATARGQTAATTNSTVLLTVDGTVEIQHAGASDWSRGAVSQALSFGDRLRTAASSRATVRLTPLTVLRANESTTSEIQPPAPPNKHGRAPRRESVLHSVGAVPLKKN